MALPVEPARPSGFLSARWLNAIVDAVRMARVVPGNGVRVNRTAGGQVVSVKLPQEADFRVTSGVNPYAGVEQQPGAAGTWSDLTGGRTVTTAVDPLYERNNAITITAGTIVHARRDIASGCWIFDRANCAPSTAIPVTAPAPKPIPTTPARSPAPPLDLGGFAPQGSAGFPAANFGSIGLKPLGTPPVLGGRDVGVSTATGGGP